MNTPSVTVHCWWPNWNIIAAGLGAGGLVLPPSGAALWDLLSIRTLPLFLLGLRTLLVPLHYLLYCRVTITPWELQRLSSGLRKSRYAAPLAAVMIGRWRGRPELKQAHAAISIFEEQDWDTGTPYLELQVYGAEIFNGFRKAHFARIEAGLAAMLAQRAASALFYPTIPPPCPTHETTLRTTLTP